MEDAMKPHYIEEQAFESAASIFKTAQLEPIQCRWISNTTKLLTKICIIMG